jgi:DNA-binding transcriptional LysR family regulator
MRPVARSPSSWGDLGVLEPDQAGPGLVHGRQRRYLTVQSLVAAGVGVSTLPALALAAHRHPDVVLTRLPGTVRHVLAATYEDPPDPPAVTALLSCLAAATGTTGDWSP